jgi:putative colanic acid biosysnthesis UDP-glucose lipid carrier transferase
MADHLLIRQNWSAWGVWHRFADAICIILGLLISVQRGLAGPVSNYVIAATLAIIIYGLLAEVCDMYRNWRGVSENREAVGTLMCWGSTWMILLLAAFVTKYSAQFSRISTLVWLVVTPVLIMAVRIATRWFQRARQMLGYNTQRFAIVGVNPLAFQLAENIEASPQLGLSLAGFFDDRPDTRNPEIPSTFGRRIGTLEDLIDQARTGTIDRIYIAFPMRAEKRIRSLLDRLGDTTASVYIVPDFFVFQLLHSRWTDILGLPVVSVFESPIYGIDGLAKHAVDMLLGSLLLLIAAVPMAAIAAWIKFTSPGPALFRQMRYGLDGRGIRIWKFRTMTVCEEGARAVQATRDDPRVTWVGKILRRTSLDELPQLFNVLAGTMSLVGPRPHATAQNEEFRSQIEGYMLRHKVKPGMTGLAQVSGWRGQTDSPEKMKKRIECDLRYIREWSMWLDTKILFKTVWVVISGKNAY